MPDGWRGPTDEPLGGLRFALGVLPTPRRGFPPATSSREYLGNAPSSQPNGGFPLTERGFSPLVRILESWQIYSIWYR